MDYLQQHKDGLIPEFRQVWETAGFKTSGTWEEVFGKGAAADEIFMAWNFARYVGRVAEAGKAEYPMPMFVNAALTDSEGRTARPRRTERRPHGTTRWTSGGPGRRKSTCSRPTFTTRLRGVLRQVRPIREPAVHTGDGGCSDGLRPESSTPSDATMRSVSRYGGSKAGGSRPEMIRGYELIAQLAPLIAKHQGNGTMSAVLLGPNDPPQKIQVGNYTLEVSYLKPRVLPGAPQPQPPFPNAAAIFIATGPENIYAAGNGVAVTFRPTRRDHRSPDSPPWRKCFCGWLLGSRAPAGRR